jgi:predicted dehydrogenase
MSQFVSFQSRRMTSGMPWGIAVGLLSGVISGGAGAAEKPLRVGMIGLDTSHCIAFAESFNDEKSPQHVPGCRVTHAYPKGSPDIQSSVSRVPEYTEKMRGMGVAIVNDIGTLVNVVDVVLLETNDGRPHLEQVVPVLRAGKPVFIDKPVAGSLADAVAIYRLAEHHKVPVFSASSLRFAKGTLAVRGGAIGDVTGCDTFSPCSIEPSHPDLFWYGIHGCESLFTVMGTGCETVVRTHTDDFDQVTGTWNDGRIGTFRGIRRGKGGYGGVAFGTTGSQPVGGFDGYRPLAVEVVTFFQTGQPPVSAAETIEIYAFMEAADESKRRGGVPVSVREVLSKAEAEAARKMAALIESK